MEILFTDPKLNAMRQAAVAGNWAQLFRIAPRGCVGSAGPTMADGSRGACGDDANIPLGSPEGEAAYYYWNRTNPTSKNLTINDLRVTKNASGQIQKVPLTESEIRDYFDNYQWARHDWKCTPGQLEKYTFDAMGGRKIYPLAQCAESSATRRRKAVKKVAAVAVLVTGAIFLGPAILAAAGKGAAAVGAGVSKVGAAAGGLVKHINNARTVKAIAEGKAPPPPIDVNSSSFGDWAFEVGVEEWQKSAQRKMTRSEENALRAEISAMQRELAATVPPFRPQPNYELSPTIKKIQVIEEQRKGDLEKLMIPGAIVAGALLLGG